MTPTEAATAYKNIKTAYDNDEAEYIDINNVRIVQARQNVTVIGQRVANAKQILESAGSTEEIKVARVNLQSEELEQENAIQLVNNLNSKITGWKTALTQRRHNLDVAHREMWVIKRKELLDNFDLSDEVLLLVENLIAANDGIDAGFKPRNFGSVIDEKYNKMDSDLIKERKAALLSSMGI